MKQKLSERNKVKIYDYISLYEWNISKRFGEFNLKDTDLISFRESNSILLGSLCNSNKDKIRKYKFFILWDDDKPSKYNKDVKNDSAHNLLRHIRNSMAHGLIFAENRQKFALEDLNKNNNVSMYGKISSKLFFQLIEAIIQTSK